MFINQVIETTKQVPTPVESNDPKNDIVVIGRRRPTLLDGIKPQEELSEAQIGTFGARSIGDLIEKLLNDRGGQPFSIVVNGRRLASTADIASLPAEALASLQLYSSQEGVRYGYSPPGQLLNLTLKTHFRFAALDLTGSGSTDGGGKSVSAKPNRTILDNGNRFNADITVQADAGLLAGQRPRDPSEPDETEGRSLVPRSRRLNALIGASRPLGGGTVDVNVTATVSQNINRMSADLVQATDLSSASVTASYGGNFHGLFGNVFAVLNAAQSRLRTTERLVVTNAAFAGQSIRTDTLGGSLGMNLSGSILKLPTGTLQFNTSLQRGSIFTSFQEQLEDQPKWTIYTSTSGQAGLTVPLVPSGGALSKVLGTLAITPSVEYSRADGLGDAWGRSIAAQWSPFPSLSISGSLARRPLPPTNDQINAPATILIGRTVFDYRVGALVPVEQIVGGAPLARRSVSDRQVSAMLNRALGTNRMAINVNYASSTTTRPPFSVIDPSLFLERAFPNRFLRDASGNLIRVDTRPFSALRRSSAQVSASLNLSGRSGRTRPKGLANAITWSISFNVQRRLQESLLLAQGIPVIDLLTTPLTFSTGARGRNQWGMDWRVNTERVGGSLSTSWNSGLTAKVFDDPDRGVRIGSLVQVNGNLFFQFRQSQVGKRAFGKASTPYRLDLNVRNLFNARPDIQTYTKAGVTRLNPWQLDPLGRTITVSLRLPLGG